MSGAGAPEATAEERRASLRANRAPGWVWAWALLAGGLGLVALVLALRLANRMVMLPEQQIPDLSQVPSLTVVSLLLMGAPVAGIVEEAAFRGYMQGPIERRYGLPVAILITGTMFAVAHLDFTWILWPYYVVCGGHLRHRHLLRQVDPASGRAAHGRESLFELRSVAARSGGVAGCVGRHGADLTTGTTFSVLYRRVASVDGHYAECDRLSSRGGRKLPG